MCRLFDAVWTRLRKKEHPVTPLYARTYRFLAATLLVLSAASHAGVPIGTTTTVASLSNPSTPNQAVQLGAFVHGLFPSGTVTFSDEAGVLCNAISVVSSSSTGIAYCTASFGEGAYAVT